MPAAGSGPLIFTTHRVRGSHDSRAQPSGGFLPQSLSSLCAERMDVCAQGGGAGERGARSVVGAPPASWVLCLQQEHTETSVHAHIHTRIAKFGIFTAGDAPVCGVLPRASALWAPEPACCLCVADCSDHTSATAATRPRPLNEDRGIEVACFKPGCTVQRGCLHLACRPCTDTYCLSESLLVCVPTQHGHGHGRDRLVVVYA